MAKIRELENQQISTIQKFSQQEKQLETISNKTKSLEYQLNQEKEENKDLKEQLFMIISVAHQGETTIEILKEENRQQQNEITILKGTVKVLSTNSEKTLQKIEDQNYLIKQLVKKISAHEEIANKNKALIIQKDDIIKKLGSLIQGYEKDIDQAQHEMSRFISDSVINGAERELFETALKQQNVTYEKLLATNVAMKDKMKKIKEEKFYIENKLIKQKSKNNDLETAIEKFTRINEENEIAATMCKQENENVINSLKNELTNLKELAKHESVSQQKEVARLSAEIAKLKDLFQTCQRKVNDIEQYKEIKGRSFFSFRRKLDPSKIGQHLNEIKLAMPTLS